MMLTQEEFKHECEIAIMEVRELTNEQLCEAIKDFKDPDYVKKAVARGKKFFGDSTIYMVVINYFACKNELKKRLMTIN